jgi:hypothetical protein
MTEKGLVDQQERFLSAQLDTFGHTVNAKGDRRGRVRCCRICPECVARGAAAGRRRTELMGRRIVLSHPLDNRHSLIASSLYRALLGEIPEDWSIFQQAAIEISPRLGVLMPDLVVVPEEPLSEEWRDSLWFPARLALLVVEITD